MSAKIPNFPPFTIQPIPFIQSNNSQSENDNPPTGESGPTGNQKPAVLAEERKGKKEGSQKASHGYYICSTGNIHVDEPPFISSAETSEMGAIDDKDWLTEIAEKSIRANNLVIAIHGYSVSDKGARNWYSRIFSYISGGSEFTESMTETEQSLSDNIVDGASIRQSIQETVFLGYRWPAEPRGLTAGRYVFEALPTMLLSIFLSAFVFGLVVYSLLTTSSFVVLCCLVAIALILSIWILRLSKSLNQKFTVIAGVIILSSSIGLSYFPTPRWILGLLSIASFSISAMILMLILLRWVAYSRDRYRASNYGTTDLVELIRQLDQRIHAIKQEDAQKRKASQKGTEQSEDKQGKDNQSAENGSCEDIMLSFVAHSLGCEVLTQAIRILSNVFAPAAISQVPEQKLGKSFELGRLILVAPDIPIESILQGRANFLKSSLRRVKEAYVFSSEADLALRFASTAANYISFPAKNRFRGYKLGNITVQNFRDQNEHGNGKIDYDLNRSQPQLLEIRASDIEHLNLLELSLLDRPEQTIEKALNSLSAQDAHHLLRVANGFTYFDCTDYVDIQIDYQKHQQSSESKGVLSFAKKSAALNFIDYVRLMKPFLFASQELGTIDVHGGYFRGDLSQHLIYGLAFLGQQKFLTVAGLESLDDLRTQCLEKQIRVILSGTQMKSTVKLMPTSGF